MKLCMVFLIGLSLSMDTFSLALSLGTFKIKWKKCLLYCLVVGLMHFIMPLLGYVLSFFMDEIMSINYDLLFLLVLLFILYEMIHDLFIKKSHIFKFNTLEMLICAFSVSIDSFTIGLCFNDKITFVIIACIIFFTLSFLFTYLGFLIGKKCQERLGILANITGIIIIILLIGLHLFL